MQFHDLTTNYEYFRKKGLKQDYRTFYAGLIALAQGRGIGYDLERNNLAIEHNWYQERRPYYNIWPGIIPLFLSLKLDIDSDLIKPPSGPLGFRLPVGNEQLTFQDSGQPWAIRTILTSPCDVLGHKGMSLFIDIGETSPDGGPIRTIRNFELLKGRTIEQSLTELPEHESINDGVTMPDNIMADCVRIVCGACLLRQGNSDLIHPSVLNKDAGKYAHSQDPKYVNKAHRRGKIIWDIGKSLEKAPHFRRAHLAIYWTGPGRKVPIIKLRGADKPIIVHRDQAEKLPTDFLDKDQP